MSKVRLLEDGQRVYSYPEEDPNFEGNIVMESKVMISTMI